MLMMWTARPLVVAASALLTRWGWDPLRGRPRWSGRRCKPTIRTSSGWARQAAARSARVDHHSGALALYICAPLPMWGSVLIAPVGEPSERTRSADGDDRTAIMGRKLTRIEICARPPLDRRGWWYWGDAVPGENMFAP